MADTSNLSQFLGDVADAIRNKKGTTDPIPAANFDTEIESIPTGSVVEKIVAEANQITEEETVVKIESAPITEPVVIPENGKAEVLADKTLLAQNIGLTPDKIAKGNTILNVEGIAEGGGGPIVENDGPVNYVFRSEEEANAFTGFRFGDTATILTEQNRPAGISEVINGGFRFMSSEINGHGFWHCQKNVTLNEPITYSDMVEIITGEGNKQTTNTFSVDITDTYCEVKLMIDTVSDPCSGTAKWTSSDGINYVFAGRTSEDDEALDIDYFSLGGAEYGSTYLQYMNIVIDLFTKASNEFTNPDIFRWFFYIKAKDAFGGFWQIDADNIYSEDTDKPDMIYSVDLAKTRLTQKQSDCHIVYKHTPYNVVEDYPILQGAGIKDDSTYGNIYVRKDNIYYILHGFDIKYFIDEDEYYLCKSSYIDDEIAQVGKKYDADTGKYTTMTERTINGILAYDILTDPDVMCYFSLNDDGTVEWHGYHASVDVYQNKSASTRLYLQYIFIKGNLVISKNDFGIYTEPDDVKAGKSAITNTGVIKGTMISSGMTKEEETEAIAILNTVLGGE